MAQATGSIAIASAGGSFDSATYPRFVLGDGTNSLTFVIDNTARGLLLEDESTAATSYSSTGDFPLEDPMKGNILIPTIDEADGAQKSIMGLWLHDSTSVNTLAAAIASESVLDGSDNLIAVTSRLHFEVTDADGNTIRIGLGGSTQAKKSTVEGHMQGGAYRHQAQNGTGQTWYSAYQESSTSTNYLVHVTTTGGGDDYAEYRLPVALYGAFKAAYEDDNINIDAFELCKEAAGDGLRQSALGSNAYGAGADTYTRGVLLQYKTAGFKGNACRIVLKDPNGVLDSDAKQRGISYGYEEYTSATMRAAYGNRDDNLGTNNNFPGESLNTEIYFRGGTIAGSGSDTALTTANLAEAIKEIVNGSKLGITATRDGSTVSLENDTDGDSGNVTITTTNKGSLFSVSGMSNAGEEGGSEDTDVARRSTISADQLALSSSGGLASSSDNKSAIKLDLSGSLSALGASPASTDLLAVAHRTTGVVTKITVSELIGAIAAGSDTQVQFNQNGSLAGSSGLTFNGSGSVTVGNDLLLASDSAILSLGAGADATFTHDGTTGLTIAATPISIDSTGELHLNSTTGDIKLQDGGVDQIAFDLDGTAGEVIMKPAVDSDDLVFAQYDGTEVIRIEDNGAVDFAGGAGSTGVTVSAAGAITVDGISTLGATTGVTVSAAGVLNVDNATDATSATDGSLQTDGGLSVVKDVVAGNDVKLLSDSAVLSLGADSDATLTHDGTTGVTLAANPITLDSAGDITLDADGADVVLKDGGTEVGSFNMASSNLSIKSAVSDKDIIFMGNDGGSAITALTLDMSNAGRATFNENVVVSGDLTVQGTTTTVDSTTIHISQSFTFEGPADDHETTLHAGTPTQDLQVNLPQFSASAGAATYHLPVLADATTAAAAAVTAAEFALLDGGSSIGTTALAAADGFMHNDNGTMKHTKIEKIGDFLAGGGTAGIGVSSGVLEIDIAGMSALGGASIAQADEFMFSDAGTEKKVTFSNLEDSIFGNVSGDATVAAGGALTIAADAVEGSMLNDNVISGQTELAQGSLAAADEIMISDGGTLKKFGVDSLAKDAMALTTEAALTVADDYIVFLDGGATGETKKEQFSDVVTNIAGAGIAAASGVLSLDIDELSALGGTGVAQGDHFVFSDDGTEKKITFSNMEDAIFGNVSGDIAVAAGGAVTIQADAVESGMLNDDVISGQTELASDGLAAADEMMISDAGTLKKIGVDNLFKDGPGLLTAATIAVGSDHIMFLDGGATGDAKIESVTDVVAGIASNGLQASSGQLSITSVEDHFVSSSSTGAGGTVFTLSQTASSAAAVSVYVNGIFQVQSGSLHASIAGGDYSINGGFTQITLVDANAIDASDEVVIKYIQK